MKRDPIQGLIAPGADGSSIVARRAWSIACVALAAALVWIIGWYWSAGAGMVAIWARSETFAHGYIVAPISLWLIWRARAETARATPRPSWWILPLIGAAGFGWLLGELGAVNALSQFAFVALLVLAVPAVLGVRAARTIAFPLAFLFFAVPVGEFVMPQLMEWTADFTVKAIQLTDIPVYREGQSFVIPTGRWSVVEACSGVRYLIASLVIGTLYAYLTYRSLMRRLVFIGFSIAVPIVANWVRAYMIVMIGHLSGNSLAVGADHLIYGWVFFGVVILVMFWVGAYWRDDDAPVMRPPRPFTPDVAASHGELLLVTAMIAVVTVVWPLGYRVIERNDATSTPSLAVLAPGGGWSANEGNFADWQPKFLDPSAELRQTFQRGATPVAVYLGYYRNQSHGRKLVSSDNVLLRSDDPVWTRVDAGKRSIDAGGSQVDASRMEFRNRLGERVVAWHWYWIDGRLTASDARAKAYIALSRLLGRGDDAAIVVVYAPERQPGDADAAIAALIREMGPGMSADLARARDAR
jgi:exosortase A